MIEYNHRSGHGLLSYNFFSYFRFIFSFKLDETSDESVLESSNFSQQNESYTNSRLFRWKIFLAIFESLRLGGLPLRLEGVVR